jgi:hypothetical protein
VSLVLVSLAVPVVLSVLKVLLVIRLQETALHSGRRTSELPPTRQRASASKAVFRANLKARTAAAKRARNK